MGQIAWISVFMLVILPIDVNDNRRHVHVFYKGKRKQKCIAKIWIESLGEKNIEVEYSSLSEKENNLLINAIDNNWDFINEQITKTFNGEKTIIKELKTK